MSRSSSSDTAQPAGSDVMSARSRLKDQIGEYEDNADGMTRKLSALRDLRSAVDEEIDETINMLLSRQSKESDSSKAALANQKSHYESRIRVLVTTITDLTVLQQAEATENSEHHDVPEVNTLSAPLVEKEQVLGKRKEVSTVEESEASRKRYKGSDDEIHDILANWNKGNPYTTIDPAAIWEEVKKQPNAEDLNTHLILKSILNAGSIVSLVQLKNVLQNSAFLSQSEGASGELSEPKEISSFRKRYDYFLLTEFRENGVRGKMRENRALKRNVAIDQVLWHEMHSRWPHSTGDLREANLQKLRKINRNGERLSLLVNRYGFAILGLITTPGCVSNSDLFNMENTEWDLYFHLLEKYRGEWLDEICGWSNSVLEDRFDHSFFNGNATVASLPRLPIDTIKNDTAILNLSDQHEDIKSLFTLSEPDGSQESEGPSDEDEREESSDEDECEEDDIDGEPEVAETRKGHLVFLRRGKFRPDYKKNGRCLFENSMAWSDDYDYTFKVPKEFSDSWTLPVPDDSISIPWLESADSEAS